MQRGKLRILSYNVLADCYCDKRNYPTKEKGEIDFVSRFEKLMKVIKRMDADIVCLQELDMYDDYYQPFLKSLGYEAHYVPKHTRSEGIAIFWNTQRFHCISKHTYHF